ncbi:MAG: hypothetical protein KIT84_08115 [Labilithrix sp.]|nr:hypothetical protein [Labilithrix sp.]MCW5810962.1 hypothetical protein [Labilithrix sp.]
MKRAPFLAAFAAAAASALTFAAAATVGCNELETVDPPDAAPRACDPGPFVFNDNGDRALPLPNEQTENTCSGDGTGEPVIERLPRGGRYGVGWKVQLVGARDQQGDCDILVVCTCAIPNSTPPPEPEPEDAGPDADPDAAPPPPPPPPPPPGAPTWRCE